MKKLFMIFTLTITFDICYSQDATIVYKNTVNSTVTIETDIMLGSGFFIDKDIIVTNFHVIKGSTEVYCYTNNSEARYKIEGYLAVDKTADLILLKISGLIRQPLKFAKIPPTQGQKVFVIGSPKGLPASISDGIVSGLRETEGLKLIQITAPISLGSSGGPVLNSNGELIGVSVGQYNEGQNLNFAIPINYLESLLTTKTSFSNPISSISGSFDSFENIEDNQSYKIVKIGNQIWMAENLRAKILSDGTPIQLVTGDLEWSRLTAPAFCWYNTYKGNYGALYNWYAVNTGKLCPQGWHVPSNEEWTSLINYLGGEVNARSMLQDSGTDRWNGDYSIGTNETGFTALPGGKRSEDGTFGGSGNIGCWWTSTESGHDKAWFRYMFYSLHNIGKNETDKRSGISVRCIKD